MNKEMSLDVALDIIGTLRMMKIDELSKAIYIQSKSFDKIEELAKNKIDMLASIPAILPVSLKNKNKRKRDFFQKNFLRTVFRVEKNNFISITT